MLQMSQLRECKARARVVLSPMAIEQLALTKLQSLPSGTPGPASESFSSWRACASCPTAPSFRSPWRRCVSTGRCGGYLSDSTTAVPGRTTSTTAPWYERSAFRIIGISYQQYHCCNDDVSFLWEQEAQLMLTNPRDAFRGQSRSPNRVPFDVLCMV